MRPGETQILQMISNADAIFLDHLTKLQALLTMMFLWFFQMSTYH